MKKVYTLFVCLALALTACLDTSAALQQPATTPTATQTTTATAAAAATEAPMTCTVAAQSLHVRSGPGVSYAVTDYLYAGEIVTIQTQRGAWLKVTTERGAGYIHSHYCEKVKP